jgi:hypothetical protein
VRLAIAVCAAGEESNPLHWALDFFTDPDAVVKLGETAYSKLGNPYKAI